MNDPEKVTYFGETDARNQRVKFGIKAKDRTKHMYVIGKTGMGKSTLLENLAIQDIQNGEGLAFIDPHGGTAEKLLEYVPEHRIKDVLYFAPFDTDYPVSFNVMEDVGADKRHLVVNGLMSTFEKIWVDAWSARMAYILNNTLLALLEYPDSTLLGVNRMLADKEYRKKVVDNVKDPSVKSFWVEEFGKYTERFAAEATPAIQNKVGQFTSNPLVRNLIGQPQSSFDIRKMMDEKKILIVNLSKGRVGEGNAKLIGSMLITKIYLAAMSRADLSASTLAGLPNFYLYVDEFQSFANKSFADILSEARKYKLNLTIAHQYIEQMEEEVRDAVFGNVGTMITFRVGAYDAEVLEKEFAPTFTAEDLVNLGFVQIYLKLMIDGVSSQPFSATTMSPIAKADITYKEDIIAYTREHFARPKDQVEEEIKAWHEAGTDSVKKDSRPPRSDEGRPFVPRDTKQEYRAPRPPLDYKPFEKKEAPPVKPPEKFAIKEAFAALIAEEKKSEVKDVAVPEIFKEAPALEVAPKQEPAVVKAVQQPEVRPLQPQQSIHNQKQSISLSNLRPPQKKNDKNPTPEHVNQLRDALASLKKTNTPTVKPAEPSVVKSEEKKGESNSAEYQKKPGEKQQSNTEQKSDTNHKREQEKPKPRSQVNEIPEDELRKLLEVDG